MSWKTRVDYLYGQSHPSLRNTNKKRFINDVKGIAIMSEMCLESLHDIVS